MRFRKWPRLGLRDGRALKAAFGLAVGLGLTCFSASGAANQPGGLAAPGSAQTIDLATTLRLAGAQALDVQIARQTLQSARAEQTSATWQFFPWVSPGVTYRAHNNLIQDAGGNIFDVNKEAFTVGPALTGQLDLGEALFRRLAAQQRVTAAAHGLEAQQQETTFAAAQAYFDLLAAHAGRNVADAALGIATNYAGQVQRAAGIGLAFRGDLLRAAVQAERQRLTQRRAQERTQTATARLIEVLHLEPGLPLTPQETEFLPLRLVPENAALAPLMAQALSLRPELRQDHATLAAARKTYDGAVYGPLIPSVGAQLFWGGLGGSATHVPYQFGETEDYFVGLGWRLGPGGLFDVGRKRSAQASLESARLAEQKMKDQVAREVVEALARVQSFGDQMVVAERTVRMAEEALRLAQQRKEFAVGVVLEDIQAQQDLTQARLEYVTALAEFNKSQYALQRAIGVLK